MSGSRKWISWNILEINNYVDLSFSNTKNEKNSNLLGLKWIMQKTLNFSQFTLFAPTSFSTSVLPSFHWSQLASHSVIFNDFKQMPYYAKQGRWGMSLIKLPRESQMPDQHKVLKKGGSNCSLNVIWNISRSKIKTRT